MKAGSRRMYLSHMYKIVRPSAPSWTSDIVEVVGLCKVSCVVDSHVTALLPYDSCLMASPAAIGGLSLTRGGWSSIVSSAPQCHSTGCGK